MNRGVVTVAMALAVVSAGTIRAEDAAATPPATTPAVTTEAGAYPEEKKIESLLLHIKNLETIKFVRNGKELTGPQAEAHLRKKWTSKKKDIPTAFDFIEKLATASSSSGKPYEMLKADGTRVPSGDYLKEKLKMLEEKLKARDEAKKKESAPADPPVESPKT